MVCGDHNGLNNQRSNLRPCSQGQNNGNSRQRVGRSGFRGVYLKKETLRWAACISPHRHLGTYSTPEEAARAYDEAAIERFGEFATLNFPQERERWLQRKRAPDDPGAAS